VNLGNIILFEAKTDGDFELLYDKHDTLTVLPTTF